MGERLSTHEIDPRERKGWEDAFLGIKRAMSKAGLGKFNPTIYLGRPEDSRTPRIIVDVVFTDLKNRPETVSVDFFNSAALPLAGRASARVQWNIGNPTIVKVEHFFSRREEFSQSDLIDGLQAVTQAVSEAETNGLLRTN
jgi:hypothetical protein